MEKIKVLIVDDHPLMREALHAAIEDEPDMEVVGEAGNGLEAVEQARLLKPDVIVMDLFMPGKDGLEAIAEIKGEDSDARILALTSSTDETKVVAAVQAGALGYLLKDARRDELLQGIREVSRGQAFLPPHLARKLMDGLRRGPPRPTDPSPDLLTDREQEVLKLIGQGASNREIAETLYLSEGTVRTHVHHILDKLHLKNRNQVILYALRVGMSDK
jgi:NarL family two-component system response regulator LiaR